MDEVCEAEMRLAFGIKQSEQITNTPGPFPFLHFSLTSRLRVASVLLANRAVLLQKLLVFGGSCRPVITDRV